MGLKIKNVLYDKHDNYLKINSEKTELFQDKKQRIKERKALLRENIPFLLNDLNLLDDKSQHIWIKLCDNKNALISFKDVRTGTEIINKLIQTIKKISTKKETHERILKIFENFHWISVIDKETLAFKFLIEEENSKEMRIMKNIIVNYSRMTEKNGVFYLE